MKKSFNWKYFLSFFIISFIIFWLLIYLPVRTIPGNDFTFQLKILSFKELALFITLSLLISLSLVMQIYLWKKTRSAKKNLTVFSAGGIGSFSGVVASIFGAATCASCLTVLSAGFLGIGAILALVEYRTYIVWGAIILLLISIYLTAQRLKNVCENRILSSYLSPKEK